MTVVFIHGLGQGTSSWDEVIKHLDRTDVKCIDLIVIKKKEPLNYQMLYDEVKRQCSQIPEPIHLVGLSLGGVLAMNYAIDFPEKVNSMTIINSQYKMPKFLLSIQNIIFRVIPKKKFDVMGFSKEDFISIIRSMKKIDFTDRLKQLSVNSLIVNGEKDKLNYKSAKEMVNLLTNAIFISVPNAGHEINKDASQELAKVISNFLSTL